MSEQPILTSISVTGVAVGKYDAAVFSCVIRGEGASGSKAKADARPALDGLAKLIAALKADGVHVDDDALTTKPQLDPVWDHSSRTQKIAGYSATYSVTIKSNAVDRASEVYDKLTELPNTAATMAYKINDLTALHEAALDDAVAKLDQQFATQCAKLRIASPKSYDICHFSVSNSESQSAGPRGGRAYAMAASASIESVGGGAPPVKLESGAAVVTCSLSADYTHVRYLSDRTRLNPKKGTSRKNGKTVEVKTSGGRSIAFEA